MPTTPSPGFAAHGYQKGVPASQRYLHAMAQHRLPWQTATQQHCNCSALLTHQVVSPALAKAGEVLAMGDLPLVQLAGEHRDAVHPCVVPNQWQAMQSLRLRVFSSTYLSR